MKYFTLLASVVLWASCTNNLVYQGNEPVPEGNWERSWQPSFEFEVDDTTAQHDLFVDLRHTNDYPFSNLYLFVQFTDPAGKIIRDTVECPLSSPDGRWYGKGLGFIRADRFQAHVLFKYHNRFPMRGRYKVQLEQAMRTEGLDGVLDVGISVERS